MYREWYEEQNGRPNGTCSQADVTRLRAEVERHEGLTRAGNSHFGIANATFLTHRPDQTLEELYMYNVTEERLRMRAYDLFVRYIRGPNRSAQRAFDQTDYPVIAAKFACTFDFNRMDG